MIIVSFVGMRTLTQGEMLMEQLVFEPSPHLTLASGKCSAQELQGESAGDPRRGATLSGHQGQETPEAPE